LAVPDGSDFLPALIYWIYEHQIQLADREWIDEEIRTMTWSATAAADPSVKKLCKRSKRSREIIWHDEQPERPEHFIEHVSLGLERWASAFLLSDTAQFRDLPRKHNPPRLIRLAPLQVSASKRQLAVAVPDGVALYALQARGTIFPDPQRVFEVENDSIYNVARLPGKTSDRLLAVSGSGRLYLLEPEPSGNQLRRVNTADCQVQGRSWAMTVGPHRNGSTPLAVVCNQGRRSSLVMGQVDGDRLVLSTPQPSDLPGACALDLSMDGGSGYWLMAGSDQAMPVLLYRLDQGRRLQGEQWVRVLRSGALAVRFSADKNPGFAAFGGRSGLLWCIDLNVGADICDLAWSYQLKGAVRSMERCW
jgi:hypothetical protein